MPQADDERLADGVVAVRIAARVVVVNAAPVSPADRHARDGGIRVASLELEVCDPTSARSRLEPELRDLGRVGCDALVAVGGDWRYRVGAPAQSATRSEDEDRRDETNPCGLHSRSPFPQESGL